MEIIQLMKQHAERLRTHQCAHPTGTQRRYLCWVLPGSRPSAQGDSTGRKTHPREGKTHPREGKTCRKELQSPGGQQLSGTNHPG